MAQLPLVEMIMVSNSDCQRHWMGEGDKEALGGISGDLS